MARPQLRQTGFTLIELLLAMVLLTLLMLSAGLAYDYINQNWSRNQTSFRHTTEQHIDWRLVYQVIQNTYPRLVFATAPSDSIGASQPDNGFYFLGRDNGFTGVSYVSVQEASQPAVFRLFREPDPKNPQHWQLVYEEALIAATGLYHAEQVLPFNFRRVLAVDIEQVEFSYFGFEDLRERNRSVQRSPFGLQQEGALPTWFAEFDGLERRTHPLGLRLVLNNDQLDFPLQDSQHFPLRQVSGGALD